MRQHDRDVGGARIGEMDEVGPGRRPERTLTGLVLAFRRRLPVAVPRGVVAGTSADALGRISGATLAAISTIHRGVADGGVEVDAGECDAGTQRPVAGAEQRPRCPRRAWGRDRRVLGLDDRGRTGPGPLGLQPTGRRLQVAVRGGDREAGRARPLGLQPTVRPTLPPGCGCQPVEAKPLGLECGPLALAATVSRPGNLSDHGTIAPPG